MSTDRPAGSDVPSPVPAESPALTTDWQAISAAMADVVDPSVINNLAQEFMAALPHGLGAAASGFPLVKGNSSPANHGDAGSDIESAQNSQAGMQQLAQAPMGASVPSASSFYFLETVHPGASAGTPMSPTDAGFKTSDFAPAPGSTPPSVPNAPAGSTGLPSQAAEHSPAPMGAGSSFYFLEGKAPHASGNGSAPSLPTDLFTMPGLPLADSSQNSAAIPGSSPIGHDSEPQLASVEAVSGNKHESKPPVNAPVMNAESSSVSPHSAPKVRRLSNEVGQSSPSSAYPQAPGKDRENPDFYFLEALKIDIPERPPFPPVSELFSLPGLPGMQSLPGTPGMPSSLPSQTAGGTSSSASSDPRVSTGFEFPTVPRPATSPTLFDPRAVRRDFPILQEKIHGRDLVWLDNAATTQKPNAVIDRLTYYYRHENSNVHRAAHTLAARATDAYESAREKTRRFLNASSTREIIFVRGATEGINLVAKSWGHRNVEKDDEIVITWLEHHANIVPWQQLCAEKGARLRVAPVNNRGEVILEEFEKLLNPRTRMVAFSHVSNALGSVTPARTMIEMAHRRGAMTLLDGAQSVSHMRENVQELDCDFFVFSGHKIFAPTGIGVVYGKAEILDTTPPWQGGGNMIMDVTFEKTSYHQAPARFEAGTGNIADAVGLGAALDYLEQVGLENVNRYEHELLNYATAALAVVPGLKIIGTAREKAGVISFVIDGLRTEDIGKALDEEGIAVRSGHHCAQPILRRFGVESTVRASLALYNTCEDIDALVAALLRLQSGRGHRGL